MRTAGRKAQTKTEARLPLSEQTFLESAIGSTPLIRLRQISKDLPENIEIYAKAEHLNPGGSVKDRAALAMILAGEETSALTKEKIILDATSGNTGIAYAMTYQLDTLRIYAVNCRLDILMLSKFFQII